MTTGVRYKFHGSQVKVLTGYDGSPGTITGVTNANPAVVSTTESLADGDVVQIAGIVGMTELNGRSFIVEVATPGASVKLVDTDSTGYGTYTSGGTIAKAEFSNLCELTNYNRTGGTSPEIDATTLCSTAKEYEIGLPDFGTTQLSFNFAPGTTVQGKLHDLFLSGDVAAVMVVLPNNGGQLTQLGFIQQETETAGVGGLWQATATMRNTGNRYDA